MKQLRLNAHLTVFELAVKSGISIRTINRVESGKEHTVTSLTAQKLLDTLSEALGHQINPEDVEGLRIRDQI